MLRARVMAVLTASVLAVAACSPVESEQSSDIASGPAAGENDLYGPPASDAKTGGSVTVASLTEPPALDPFHESSDARIQYTGLMYQGLMYEGSSGEPIPLLAKSVDVSNDNLTYTFKLREGVTFHDDTSMTSEDVKYSYDYLRDPDNGSPGAADFQAIEDIAAPDDSTVVMTLSEPNAALLMTLGNKYGAVVPDGYFDGADAKNQLNQESVGTGPYELVSLEKNSSLKLERNKDYWGKGGPYIDELVFQFMPTSAAVVVALQNQRADMAVLPRKEDANQLEGEEQIDLATFPSLNHKTLDLDSGYPPLDDVRVRQAIALAIDKEVVAQAAAPDLHQATGTMVAGMQETWGLPLDEAPLQQRDVGRAKELLAEAGHEDGVDIDLRTINGYDWMDPAAVVITQQLADVGIRVKTQKLELGTWSDNFQNREMGFTMNDWGTQPDPDLLFYRHYHQEPKGVDFRNWNNAEGSDLLDQARAASDRDKRVDLYQDFQKVFAETVPTIMLYSPEWLVATNQRLENYVHHPMGVYFGLVQAHVTG